MFCQAALVVNTHANRVGACVVCGANKCKSTAGCKMQPSKKWRINFLRMERWAVSIVNKAPVEEDIILNF